MAEVPGQSPDEFWKTFNRDAAGQEAQQRREDNAAQGTIKAVLTAAGYSQPYGMSALIRDCELLTGSPSLTFDWFHSKYPGFPVKLGAYPIEGIYKLTMREMFDGFLKSPIFKSYKEWLAQNQIDDTVDYVAFAFSEVRRKMVLHNYPRTYDIGTAQEAHNQGTRIVHQFGEVVYTIETLQTFTGLIGNRWLQDAD